MLSRKTRPRRLRKKMTTQERRRRGKRTARLKMRKM